MALGVPAPAERILPGPLSLQFSKRRLRHLCLRCLRCSSWLRSPTGSAGRRALFVIGMVTSFVDLLTAPLLTLGMPLAAVLTLRGRGPSTPALPSDLVYAMKLPWSGRRDMLALGRPNGSIGAAVLKTDVIGLAVLQLLFRTGHGQRSSRACSAAVQRNLQDLVPPVTESLWSRSRKCGRLVVVGTVSCSSPLAWAFGPPPVGRESLEALQVCRRTAPYLWFVVANNHSQFHAFHLSNPGDRGLRDRLLPSLMLRFLADLA